MREKTKSSICSFSECLNKERLIRQKALIIWLTWISGLSKITKALILKRRLNKMSFKIQGYIVDFICCVIYRGLNYSIERHLEDIRRMTAVSPRFIDPGMMGLISFISSFRCVRQLARIIISVNHYYRVSLNIPFEINESSKPQELCANARRTEILNSSGSEIPYLVSEHPDLEIRVVLWSITETLNLKLDFLLPKIVLNEQ